MPGLNTQARQQLKARPIRTCIVTLSPEARHVLAANEGGQVFDEIYQRVK